MDSKYQVSHQKGVSQVINKICNHLHPRIRSSLSKSVIISADMWSKPDLTASFLGVTVHFFTSDSEKRHSISIALRFLSPHTGVKIAELLQRMVAEWEIPCNKLFRVFTDNRSNMVAAFKAKRQQ